MRENLKGAAIKGIRTSKLVLRHIEQLVQVKEQAKEEATQLNMEGDMELNKVSEKGCKPPSKVGGKTYTNPSGREHPYSKRLTCMSTAGTPAQRSWRRSSGSTKPARPSTPARRRSCQSCRADSTSCVWTPR